MYDERNWSDLPEELINLVSKKLYKLSDFVKFRVVCKPWFSSAPLSDRPPQFPWLIEDERANGPLKKSIYGSSFYSFFSGEIDTIAKKQAYHRKNTMGIGHGCIFIREHNSYLLFNPLTNEEIRLPSLYFSSPYLVWTGTNPTRNRNVIVIEQNTKMENGSWAFYDRDNNDWIVSKEGPIYDSVCYFKGMLFSSDGGISTHVFDTSTKKKLYKIPPPEDEIPPCLPAIYLVESAGEILRVSLTFEWNNFEKTIFRIYKLEFDGINCPICWVKISNIGDQMLFLDSTNGFSISSKSFPGQRGNCIYFLDPEDNIAYRYNIEDGKTEKLWCPFVLPSTWFVPDLE
ncbi:putative F-box protein At3g25750 [Carex rostrata]